MNAFDPANPGQVLSDTVGQASANLNAAGLFGLLIFAGIGWLVLRRN